MRKKIMDTFGIWWNTAFLILSIILLINDRSWVQWFFVGLFAGLLVAHLGLMYFKRKLNRMYR